MTTNNNTRKTSWTLELCGALVLLCIALPLNVGVALASGTPPEAGIISGVIAALVTGAMSGSAALISGPDAGIGVLVFEFIQKHGLQNLGAIVFICGLIQLALGLTRSSRWFKAVSPAVVNGMLAGMGLLIICTQFHIMLDDTPQDTGLMNALLIPEAIIKGIFPADGSSHHVAAFLGLSTIIVAAIWSRWAPGKLKMVPNALVAIASVSTVAALFDFKVKYVTLPASLTQNISFLNLEAITSALGNAEILTAALMLAFVSSAQSLITLSAIDKSVIRNGSLSDRELMAQGVGNLICGILNVLPIVGVLLRSVTNVQNGVTTCLPNMLHGLLMVVAVLFAPALLQSIPTCVLAAMLVLIGVRLVESIWKSVHGYQKDELVVFAITAIGIIATNLFAGVLIGFFAASVKQLHHMSALEIVTETQSCGAVVMDLRGAATFLQLPKLARALEDIPLDTELHLKLGGLRYIDHACLQQLVQWELHHKGQLVINWDAYSMQLRSQTSGKRLDFNVQAHSMNHT